MLKYNLSRIISLYVSSTCTLSLFSYHALCNTEVLSIPFFVSVCVCDGMQCYTFSFSDAFLSCELRCHYNHHSSSSLSRLSISKMLPNFCPVKETQGSLVSLDTCVCIFYFLAKSHFFGWRWTSSTFAYIRIFLFLLSTHITHFLPPVLKFRPYASPHSIQYVYEAFTHYSLFFAYHSFPWLY